MTLFSVSKTFSMNVDVVEGVVPRDTLFIHGNLASNTWWEPTFEELKKQGNSGPGSLLAAEWRGCGKTRGITSEKDLSLDTLAQDYIDLLRSSGRTKVNVVGHSLGGLIALVALSRAPDLFHKAVLLNPVGAAGARLSPEILKAFQTMKTDRALCETVMASTILNCERSSPLFKRIVDDACGVSDPVWEGVPKMLNTVDVREALKGVSHPVLILHGLEDTVLPLASAEAMAALLPLATFEKVTKVGHSWNVEDPAAFATKLSSFFY